MDKKPPCKSDLKETLEKKSSVQIRLFDDKTGKVFYKHLTFKELIEISRILDDPKLS